jgi:hypothetical protein
VKALVIIAVVAHASLAGATPVRHVPPANAEAGSPVELVAEAPSQTPTLVAHVRATGTQAWITIELVRRDEAHWVAVVPPAVVVRPGLDYYLDAGDAHVFATPEWPHTLPVHASAEAERRAHDVVRFEGRRSRIHTLGDWVDYGTRTYTAGGMPVADRYYRVDADFSYKLWAYPLEELHVGYTRLIGTTAVACSTGACSQDAGAIAGWFELGLAPVEGVRFDGRVLVMAAQEFELGTRLEARLGSMDKSHIAAGIEYLGSVGTSGYFRLGWGTVPKLPMAATVEVTNFPADFRAYGVRLYYDVAREFAAGLRVGLRVGYAARIEQVAGFTGGAAASVEF